MKLTKVTLRQRKLNSGKITLYLDFYPAVHNPKTGKLSRREYLGLYIIDNPANVLEKRINKEKLSIAETIRAQRELDIIKGKVGFIDIDIQKEDFLTYFKERIPSNNQKWTCVFEHFKRYCNNSCQMQDLTTEFCDGFRTYLLNTGQLINPERKLNVNSAAGYWSTFRGLLAKAYRDNKLSENINEFLDSIDTVDTHRQYLTIDELRTLANTPCEYDVMKRASLFSCLTGLRFGDIRDLAWDNITSYPDGGYCIRITTEKTESSTTLPITDEAYALCGKPGRGNVFKDLTYNLITNNLADWIESAGITKKITFHCFRHTYATLLLSSGTDIYTVSKMLTHKNVGTTQIYTEVMDADKRKAVERLKINE